MPWLSFQPENNKCSCGADTKVLKGASKIITTLDIGEFRVVEKQRVCRSCKRTYKSDELRRLTPHGGKFGFDVIEIIGRLMFVDCQNEREIQAKLAIRNISISNSEIRFLGKRFIVYLFLAQRECQEELRKDMQLRGGYILYLDGTCEGGSPHLFSCIDGISNIVLGNQKMPTENSQYIIPLLQKLKTAYGVPIALVHDMGGAILKAVGTVFPNTPDFICHFHFLRDLGKDLFGIEYGEIRKQIRSYNIRVKLRTSLKQLKTIIQKDSALSKSLDDYLQKNESGCPTTSLDPHLSAYLLVAWILEHESGSNGFGFPFDQPHFEFYRRLQEAYPSLSELRSPQKGKGVIGLPMATLDKLSKDTTLVETASRMEKKISIFESLREAMRIASPESDLGLNDEGDKEIKTIRQEVRKFRNSDEVEALAKGDISYFKMVKQIDKYWEKLFADPIRVETPSGNFIVQPQRTNNLMEQSFRFLKRDSRKRSGHHSLSKTLKGMLADTPLVRNISNPDYMEILLKGEKNFADRFADIEIRQVRKQEHENKESWRKYPKNMSKLFKIPHLPQKLTKLVA